MNSFLFIVVIVLVVSRSVQFGSPQFSFIVCRGTEYLLTSFFFHVYYSMSRYSITLEKIILQSFNTVVINVFVVAVCLFLENFLICLNNILSPWDDVIYEFY